MMMRSYVPVKAARSMIYSAQFSTSQRKPKPSGKNQTSPWLSYSPHIAMSALFLATSNAHLLAIPATTFAIHYLVRYNHLKKVTLYLDLQ